LENRYFAGLEIITVEKKVNGKRGYLLFAFKPQKSL